MTKHVLEAVANTVPGRQWLQRMLLRSCVKVALNQWRIIQVLWNRGCAVTYNAVEFAFRDTRMFNKEEERARPAQVNILLKRFGWILPLLSQSCVQPTLNLLSHTPVLITVLGDAFTRFVVVKSNQDMQQYNKVRVGANHATNNDSH